MLINSPAYFATVWAILIAWILSFTTFIFLAVRRRDWRLLAISALIIVIGLATDQLLKQMI